MRRPALLFFVTFLLHLALADVSNEGGLVKEEFSNPVPDYAFRLDGRSLESRQRVCPTPGPGARLCDADTKCADGRYATPGANNTDAGFNIFCTSSCCSECGICGYGPTYCGEGNCTSSCEAVAMCGVYGDLTVNNGKCGMGLCCSAYGWCGVCSFPTLLSLLSPLPYVLFFLLLSPHFSSPSLHSLSSCSSRPTRCLTFN